LYTEVKTEKKKQKKQYCKKLSDESKKIKNEKKKQTLKRKR